LDAFTEVQGGNTLLFADNRAAHLQDTASLWNMQFYVLSSKWQKCDAFHQAWIWLDTAEEVHFSPYTSAVNELAICHVTSVNESFANHEVWRSSGKEEGEEKHNLEQVMIFTKAHAVYKTHSLTHTATFGITKRTI
jgi:hypothetical protein